MLRRHPTWEDSVRSLAIAAVALLAFSQGAVAAAPAAYVEKAVADASRPADDRKADALRKPDQVIAFAGVKPGQTVGEYLPGGGYWTRMLSDVVGPRGKVYALETTTWGQENVEATRKVLSEPGRGNVALDLAPLGAFHLPEKVDVFWTTLNYHDLHVPKYANVDMAAFNKAVFDALKPGGTYFIEDHAAAAGTGFADSPKLHRIEKSQVISEVEAAGFKLVGESDIQKRPADDHSKPVFDLHLATDQFLLKFRKPG
jgi:predicted methyltransferase